MSTTELEKTPHSKMVLDAFMEHAGDCRQCRSVLESFYAEMPQEAQLCEDGRGILLAVFN